MAAYDLRVQFVTDDSRDDYQNLNDHRRSLAKALSSKDATVAVWIDGFRWDPEDQSFDEEWDSDEGDIDGSE